MKIKIRLGTDSVRGAKNPKDTVCSRLVDYHDKQRVSTKRRQSHYPGKKKKMVHSRDFDRVVKKVARPCHILFSP
jgi:hypothetical protein